MTNIGENAALSWQQLSVSDTGYWDKDSLSGWIDSSYGSSNEDWGQAIISYRSLHVFVTLLARQLHDIICNLMQDAEITFIHDGESTLSISIGLAIPEGFFLPLAVAAAHALNEGTRYSVVIVPIDPTEGVERLRCTLNDFQPLIVFVASDCDFQVMQQVTTVSTGEAQQGGLYSVFDSCQPLYLASKTEVLDIRKISSNILFQKDLVDRTATEIFMESNFRLRIKDCEKHILRDSITSCFSKHSTNCISHIVYTSGTTGIPKGCISSRDALDAYLDAKNERHSITSQSVVLLASAVSFDPCISDIIATINAGATLCLVSRESLSGQLHKTLINNNVSHVLCTPTLWNTLTVDQASPATCPSLRVVALGGERISRQTIKVWARKNIHDQAKCRLFATYGVTEACVYQTMGEVYQESELNVGLPFNGMGLSICEEGRQDSELFLVKDSIHGEIVLHGRQIDQYSAYLRRPDLTRQKFCFEPKLGAYCYRTGDRGFRGKDCDCLFVLGRIDGEDGMIKYNGIRVELGEIESAILDPDSLKESVVVDSVVVLQESENDDALDTKTLIAYVVLSREMIDELHLPRQFPSNGVLCSGNLLALLVARCKNRARVTPAIFIVIPKIPLARTGKRNKTALPSIAAAVALADLTYSDSGQEDVLLSDYSPLGALIAKHIVDCLNILPSQLSLLTASATFTMLGGDSLTATRVIRAIYAHHHNISDGRALGGAYGILDNDTFAVRHLLCSKNLGEYVDFLQKKNVCEQFQPMGTVTLEKPSESPTGVTYKQDGSQLYDTLIQAITRNQILLAIALVDAGAKPNVDTAKKYRISNTRGIQERKVVFHSTPLHLACLKGHPNLVRALLENGAKYNTPDAAGSFPLHLAAVGSNSDEYCEEEDLRRLDCVKLLLNSGAPLQMKDGNKHTVIHSAARTGYVHILRYVMERWQRELIESGDKKYNGSFDWRDRWSRTAVHWAVLNGKVNALRVLLKSGCSATPIKPKKNARTNVALETPQEMCDRLYGESQTGIEISELLKAAPN